MNLNVGFTGSVLFWNTSPLSQNLYSADYTFGGGCFSSVTEPSGSGGTLKRAEGGYDYQMVSRAGQGVHSALTHQSREPAYVERKTLLSSSVYQSEIAAPLTSWSVKNQSTSNSHLEKRGGVPFLPGNIFCPTTNDQISNDAEGTDCSIYSNDPTDLDPDVSYFVSLLYNDPKMLCNSNLKIDWRGAQWGSILRSCLSPTLPLCFISTILSRDRL